MTKLSTMELVKVCVFLELLKVCVFLELLKVCVFLELLLLDVDGETNYGNSMSHVASPS